MGWSFWQQTKTLAYIQPILQQQMKFDLIESKKKVEELKVFSF